MRTYPRYNNFMLLLSTFTREHPGPGKMNQFAKLIGLTPNYLSQIKARDKPIGNKVSTRIEEALRLPFGWMDLPHQGPHQWRNFQELAFVANARALIYEARGKMEPTQLMLIPDAIRKLIE